MLSFLIAVSILIFVHELGHYALARWAGVHVTTFSVGFGPELFSYTDKKGTRWRFALIPLGGYVKFFGTSKTELDKLKESEDVDLKKCYVTKSVFQRASIIAAGPIANFIFAVLTLIFLYCVYGQLQKADFPEKGFSMVLPNSPASHAGFKVGDVVIAVDGTAVSSYKEFYRFVWTSNGRELTFDVLRDGEKQIIKATPERFPSLHSEKGSYYLGVSPPVSRKQISLPEAISATSDKLASIYRSMIYGFKLMGAGKVPLEDTLAGPVRIVQFTNSHADSGMDTFILFIAILSLNLAIMNLLPIPILDGGHLLFCLIEAITGKPVSEKIQKKAMLCGFVVLISIMGLAVVGDIKAVFWDI